MVKNPIWQCRRCKRPMFSPWVRKIPLEEGMACTPWRILLSGESHRQRSLVICCPKGRKELDSHALQKEMATHANVLAGESQRWGSLGAWWAAVNGVAQSWTQLKGLSSSSKVTWHTHMHTLFLTVFHPPSLSPSLLLLFTASFPPLLPFSVFPSYLSKLIKKKLKIKLLVEILCQNKSKSYLMVEKTISCHI